MDPETPARDQVLVRAVQPQDLEVVIAIDASILGRRRDEFFKLKLRQAFADTGVAVSLAAELDGRVVGFLLARVYYGEFGLTERAAVMDVIGVHPDFRGRQVGAALIDQLRTNLLALGIHTLPEMALAGDKPVTVAGVAGQLGLPQTALAKVFQQLVRSGLAVGTRGIGGGYRLARPARQVSVLDVLQAFEPPHPPGRCLLLDHGDGQRPDRHGELHHQRYRPECGAVACRPGIGRDLRGSGRLDSDQHRRHHC